MRPFRDGNGLGRGRNEGGAGADDTKPGGFAGRKRLGRYGKGTAKSHKEKAVKADEGK